MLLASCISVSYRLACCSRTNVTWKPFISVFKMPLMKWLFANCHLETDIFYWCKFCWQSYEILQQMALNGFLKKIRTTHYVDVSILKTEGQRASCFKSRKIVHVTACCCDPNVVYRCRLLELHWQGGCQTAL